jgi:hypothetical protein
VPSNNPAVANVNVKSASNGVGVATTLRFGMTNVLDQSPFYEQRDAISKINASVETH